MILKYCVMFQIAKIVEKTRVLTLYCLFNKEMKNANLSLKRINSITGDKTLPYVLFVHVHYRNFLWFRPTFWMRMVRICKCFFPQIEYRSVTDISVAATRLWPWILGIWAILWDACLGSSGMRVRIPVVPILATRCSCHRTLAQWSWTRPRWFSRC